MTLYKYTHPHILFSISSRWRNLLGMQVLASWLFCKKNEFGKCLNSVDFAIVAFHLVRSWPHAKHRFWNTIDAKPVPTVKVWPNNSQQYLSILYKKSEFVFKIVCFRVLFGHQSSKCSMGFHGHIQLVFSYLRNTPVCNEIWDWWVKTFVYFYTSRYLGIINLLLFLCRSLAARYFSKETIIKFGETERRVEWRLALKSTSRFKSISFMYVRTLSPYLLNYGWLSILYCSLLLEFLSFLTGIGYFKPREGRACRLFD